MLQQVLREIEQVREPVSLSALARKLEVEQSVLEGMLTFWARKGRISVNDVDEQTCAMGAGCASCAAGAGCSFAGMTRRAPLRWLISEEAVERRLASPT